MRWSIAYLISIIYSIFVLSVTANQQKTFDLYASNPYEVTDDSNLNAKYSKLSDNSLLWGPYRSSLYFGLRPRLPRSLLSGLMWFSMDNYNQIGNIRHFYEQNDKMSKANWINYNPRIGGRQYIKDEEIHFDIYIDFVKSSDGLSWGVKIKGVPHKGFENSKISFVWYSGLEGERKVEDSINVKERTGYIKLENDESLDGYEENIRFSGISEELGAFSLVINDGPETNKHPKGLEELKHEFNPAYTHHYSLTVPDDNVWQARDIFMTMLQESIKNLNDKYKALEYIPPENSFIIKNLQGFEGNLHFIQKIYQGECEFDIIYTNSMTPESEIPTFINIQKMIDAKLRTNDANFEKYYKLQPPFNEPKHKIFAQEMISGLLGGITYMYGDHLVDRFTEFDEDTFESYTLQGSYEGPHELFTLVPSRPFFPRGFYWDEGFHLLPLIKYDSDLVLDIVKSWFNLIDENGWIAREQILGPEARSRVPKEFRVQSPHIVNPPTLTLVLNNLLETISQYKDISEPNEIDDESSEVRLGKFTLSNPEVLLNYTKQIYPNLKNHFEMFRRTQKGYVEEFERPIDNNEVFRWRGRTYTHCLASGLDDYPRAIPPDIGELNVDLISWIGVMTRSLRQMAEVLEIDDDIASLKEIEKNIISNIEKLHWSKDNNAYCDISVDEDDESIFVCHKGYVSLLPFLTKMIPGDDHDKLNDVISSIMNPEELWSDFGIRSLSKSDEFYKTGENYWRSPIWINMNYLVLKSIHDYYYENKFSFSPELKSKFESAYHDLRINLIKNVFGQWQNTGFVWEQYDDETGVSKGAKNFLGWTSTIVLIMTMPENL
ncbi:CWH41 [Candida pseudojiufengensis]|uniref:CWH41 n=1 Tax=Candida pseudojiufengensis TaxID=497109 RepID=UPI002224DF7C|nr:CWH41 [Candida pseudojiufengensis]KAI5965809.1 CWH41 [Candida pseudojiufengensis]